MITEDYCSCEVAELLKEKKANINYTHYIPKYNDDGTCEAISTCSHAVAMKWLRSKNIVLSTSVGLVYDHTLKENTKTYFAHVVVIKDNSLTYPLDEEFSSEYYEDVVDAILKYVLENLI